MQEGGMRAWEMDLPFGTPPTRCPTGMVFLLMLVYCSLCICNPLERGQANDGLGGDGTFVLAAWASASLIVLRSIVCALGTDLIGTDFLALILVTSDLLMFTVPGSVIRKVGQGFWLRAARRKHPPPPTGRLIAGRSQARNDRRQNGIPSHLEKDLRHFYKASLET